MYVNKSNLKFYQVTGLILVSSLNMIFYEMLGRLDEDIEVLNG